MTEEEIRDLSIISSRLSTLTQVIDNHWSIIRLQLDCLRRIVASGNNPQAADAKKTLDAIMVFAEDNLELAKKLV